MPTLQEKCFGQKNQVKKFGQAKNNEQAGSKERKGFKTLEDKRIQEEDKENAPVKVIRKFGDKKEKVKIESPKRIFYPNPTVDDKFRINPVQTYSKMPHNLGVQSGKPFAVMFKNNSFLQNLKIKISSNSSSRKIQAPDNEPLKDLMDLSFVVNPKKKNPENIPKTLNETWASFRADFDKSINQSLGWMDQSTVVCNKVLESQLEQSLSQFEVTQIPNTLDRTWRFNEKGQKTYGGFEDWRREKNLPKIKAPLEKTSSDKKDESVAEKTFIPESLDTTWNCN